jgi:serine/threonine-protein phosphatase 2A regulatory subunit A
VRLNVISGLDRISAVIGVELLSQSLLPAITELAADSKWRVRLAVIESMPMLAKQLGVQFFNDKLVGLTLSWLSDTVSSIRKAAANNLRNLTDIFGEAWARAQIVPRVREMQTNAAFSKRLTALYAVQVLLAHGERSTAPSHAMMTDVLLPITLAMAGDPVPNIRFNVAKTLVQVVTVYKNDYNTPLPAEIAPVLAKLAADLDRDVRHYAEVAQSIK